MFFFAIFFVFLSPLHSKGAKNVQADVGSRWPDNTVPYEFGTSYSNRDKAVVLSAMEIISVTTTIDYNYKKSY